MKHGVTFEIPTRALESDVHFKVKVNGSILGKLEVSKGSLVWYPKDKIYGHKITWEQFDAVTQDYPRGERRKT